MHTILRGLYYLGGRVLLLAPKASLFERGGFVKQRRREFSSSNPGRRSYWLGPTGCGSQRLLRALNGTRILLATAPASLPCFRRWRRSAPLRFPYGSKRLPPLFDIPTGWDPNTKKEPTGLFFAACRRPCSFDSSYGLHDPATPVDVPIGWDPRANQSPTGALVTVLCTAALFDSRTGQIKNALARMRKGVFMTRTGIEPMLQP